MNTQFAHPRLRAPRAPSETPTLAYQLLRTATFGLVLTLMLLTPGSEAVAGAETDLQTVEVYEIAQPYLLSQGVRASGVDLYDHLQQHIDCAPANVKILIVATPGAVWLRELEANTSRAACNTAVRDMAEHVAKSPAEVTDDYLKTLAAIERRYEKAATGLVLFTQHNLGTTTLVEAPPPVPPTPEGTGGGTPDDGPKETTVEDPFGVPFWMVVAVLGLISLAIMLRLWLNHRTRRLLTDSVLQPSTPQEEPARKPAAGPRRYESSRTRRDDDGFSQNLRRRPSFISSLFWGAVLAASSVQAAPLPQQAPTEPGCLVVIDVSQSIDRSTKSLARELLIRHVTEGCLTEVLAMGDSTFVAGTVASLGEIDPLLEALPRMKLTRLADGIRFAVERAADLRKAGKRNVTISFLSDFVPDDHGNEAFAYIEAGWPEQDPPPGQAADSAAVAGSGSWLTRSPLVVPALLIVVFLLGAGLALLATIPRLRRRYARRRQENTLVTLSDGSEHHTFSFLELRQRRRVLLGPDEDALVMLEDPERLNTVTLSARAEDDQLTLQLDVDVEAEDTDWSGEAQRAQRRTAVAGRPYDAQERPRRRPSSTL